MPFYLILFGTSVTEHSRRDSARPHPAGTSADISEPAIRRPPPLCVNCCALLRCCTTELLQWCALVTALSLSHRTPVTGHRSLLAPDSTERAADSLFLLALLSLYRWRPFSGCSTQTGTIIIYQRRAAQTDKLHSRRVDYCSVLATPKGTVTGLRFCATVRLFSNHRDAPPHLVKVAYASEPQLASQERARAPSVPSAPRAEPSRRRRCRASRASRALAEPPEAAGSVAAPRFPIPDPTIAKTEDSVLCVADAYMQCCTVLHLCSLASPLALPAPSPRVLYLLSAFTFRFSNPLLCSARLDSLPSRRL